MHYLVAASTGSYLAMILAQDTEYILLDEPLNNLDLKHANQLMHLLEKLVKRSWENRIDRIA